MKHLIASNCNKKPYATPEIQVYQMKPASIIATSTRATQNEQYETGVTSDWY